MSVDTLSDAELRTKLLEYGYPVGPVTHTTRSILAKKLKNLIETRGCAGSRHSLAARYSSDDTDDDTSSTAMKRKKSAMVTRRQTLGNPMSPPPAVSMSTDFRGVSKSPVKEKPSQQIMDPIDSIIPGHARGATNSTRTTTKSIQKKYVKSSKTTILTDGLETGSDSDIREDINPYSQNKYLTNIGQLYNSKTHDKYISGKEEQIPKHYEPNSRSIYTLKDNKHTESSFKPCSTLLQPTKPDISGRDNISDKDLLSNYETPFLAEFTRRLSSQSNANFSSSSMLRSPTLHYTSSVSPEVKEKDSNGHFPSLRFSYSSTAPSSRHVMSSTDRTRDTMNRLFKSTTSTNKDDVRNNQNLISMVLVVVLALFFGALAVIYLGLSSKSETISSPSTEDSDIPLCFLGTPNLKASGINCLMKENVESVLQLAKQLQPILMKKAVTVQCENSSEIPYLTDSDIMKMLTSNNVKSLNAEEDLQSVQLFLIKNPQWGISLIDVSDNKATDEVLDSLDKIVNIRGNGKIGMIFLNPELPLQCHIRNKLFTIFSSLLIVSIGILAAIGTQKLFIWYIRYKKSMEEKVFKLVSEIINIVEMHHQNIGLGTSLGTQESFLAINHVRDNLILPKDRKRLAGLWDKAVKFLDENESRIRREVQQVAGEEFHVWRWLPNNNLNKSNSQIPLSNKKSKVWQGQAFEIMEGSVNNLTCSPTPCLKIRHMFDPDVENDDNWEIKVQDAILEKCGDGVKIFHIRVDRDNREGCVYMKCGSQEDAGKAYRALHGCWFDGHLVTVKYLRLERYYKRFPDAEYCTTPLKPSNNQRLSMQAHYWQSPLEVN